MDLEWHRIALVIAAVVGIVLETLGVLSIQEIISLTLLIVAVFALESSAEGAKARKEHEALLGMIDDIRAIKVSVGSSDLKLVPSNQLVAFTSQFTAKNVGELWWFNICVDMFRSQTLFDAFMGDVLSNPKTTRIRIVLRNSEKILWQKFVTPKLENHAGREKLGEPIFAEDLGNISFGLITNGDRSKEGLLSVWGEPFMMERTSTEGKESRLPRYLISIERNSELIPRFIEIFREHSHTLALDS